MPDKATIAIRMYYPKLTGQTWKDVGPLFFCCRRCAKNYLWVLPEAQVKKDGAILDKAELPDSHDGLCDRCECRITGDIVDEGS